MGVDLLQLSEEQSLRAGALAPNSGKNASGTEKEGGRSRFRNDGRHEAIKLIVGHLCRGRIDSPELAIAKADIASELIDPC